MPIETSPLFVIVGSILVLILVGITAAWEWWDERRTPKAEPDGPVIIENPCPWCRMYSEAGPRALRIHAERDHRAAA